MSVLTHPLSSFWNRVIHFLFYFFFHFPVYFLCIVLVVEAIYTHSTSMIKMNRDRIKTLRVHQWRRWQEAAKNNPIASHTHTQHPFSAGSDSCCQQPHQLSNIPLKNCLADFSIYELAVEQHLSHNYTTVTDNFHTNHQEKLKTDPKLYKATFPLCENLAKHLLHCFSAKQQGRMSKEKDA